MNIFKYFKILGIYFYQESSELEFFSLNMVAKPFQLILTSARFVKTPIKAMTQRDME